MKTMTVGTTVVKFFCLCMMESGEEQYIKIKAPTKALASEKVHDGYNIEYVLDILTEDQIKAVRKNLRPGKGIVAGISRL